MFSFNGRLVRAWEVRGAFVAAATAEESRRSTNLAMPSTFGCGRVRDRSFSGKVQGARIIGVC
jgi:hypothetical protein